jgi:hypothetical protein
VILGNRHLKALDGGQERLRLFKGDLLDRGSIAAAGAACDGFFHAASSVPASWSTSPRTTNVSPCHLAFQFTLSFLISSLFLAWSLNISSTFG